MNKVINIKEDYIIVFGMKCVTQIFKDKKEYGLEADKL